MISDFITGYHNTDILIHKVFMCFFFISRMIQEIELQPVKLLLLYEMTPSLVALHACLQIIPSNLTS